MIPEVFDQVTGSDGEGGLAAGTVIKVYADFAVAVLSPDLSIRVIEQPLTILHRAPVKA